MFEFFGSVKFSVRILIFRFVPISKFSDPQIFGSDSEFFGVLDFSDPRVFGEGSQILAVGPFRFFRIRKIFG